MTAVTNSANFDIGNYSKRTFGMFAGDENTLEIEFDNNLIGVVMDRFGKDIILNSNTENTFVAKFKCKHQFTVLRLACRTRNRCKNSFLRSLKSKKYLTYIKGYILKIIHIFDVLLYYIL
mgnify:CR=1 FL=1